MGDDELPRVLWIGGPPGTGKTTVARRLARRHGLRRYSSDTRTWEHRDRALAAGNPAAQRFEALAPAERAALTPDRRLALDLTAERGPMAVDDLRALPDAPPVLAEGTLVVPAMLPPGARARAVWLTLTDAGQAARLEARHGAGAAPAIYRRMRRHIEEQLDAAAADGGGPVRRIAVDGLDEEAVLDRVEAAFAGEWAGGVRTAGERRALARAANRELLGQYRAGMSRPWSTGDFAALVLAFECECGDPECGASVEARAAGFPDTGIGPGAAAPVTAHPLTA